MVPSVCLSDLSVRNKAFSSQNISVLPHVDLQEYDETLPPPLSFLLQKFRRRVQESTQVLRELEISLRTNHIGWVTAESARGLCSVACPQPAYIRFKGKCLAFQTPGDADTDTNHHHPPFLSVLWPNITSKAMWRRRKDESIDCSGQLTHEQRLEGKHISLAIVARQSAILETYWYGC